MKDTRLFEIFNETKQILCKYDYYIHTPKKILHLTNSELKIPHLMGLQYIGRKDLYTGDNGAYAIKKGNLTMSSIEKLVRKFYKSKEKQEQILKLIHLKLDHLYLLDEMFTTYSQLYLFDVNINPQSEFDSDYLLIHESNRKILHLGCFTYHTYCYLCILLFLFFHLIYIICLLIFQFPVHLGHLEYSDSSYT